MVQSGASVKEICLQHTNTFIRYPRGISTAVALVQDTSANQRRDVVVHVVWGKTGTGKTHGAVDYLDKKFGGDFHIQHFTGTTEWWDPYHGERAILMDEFGGSLEVSYGRLLVLLDKYKHMLPVKGGFAQASYEEVIITSNFDPRGWYANQADISALLRRLTSVTERLSLDDVWPLEAETDPNNNSI